MYLQMVSTMISGKLKVEKNLAVFFQNKFFQLIIKKPYQYQCLLFSKCVWLNEFCLFGTQFKKRFFFRSIVYQAEVLMIKDLLFCYLFSCKLSYFCCRTIMPVIMEQRLEFWDLFLLLYFLFLISFFPALAVQKNGKKWSSPIW